MRTIPIAIRGLRCRIQPGLLDAELTAQRTVRQPGQGKGKPMGEEVLTVPVYRGDGRFIQVGLGAIHFLAKHHPYLNIEYVSHSPERPRLAPFKVPEGILAAPKFRVNGRERFYFFEALEACRKFETGCVKLPVGAGKTAIELTLAWNLIAQIGLGVILVPTRTIKDQFIAAAESYGLPIKDYRKWLKEPRKELEQVILITTPKVLKNDIDSIDEWVRNQTSDDRRPVLHKHQQLHWIIADECHHAGCDTWLSIYMALTELQRSYGFSALPISEATEGAISFRGMEYEDAITISAVGPIIYQRSTRELRDFLNIPILINLEYRWGLEHEGKIYSDWPQIRKFVREETDRTQLIADVIRWLASRRRISVTHALERDYTTTIMTACRSNQVVAWMGGDAVTSYDDILRGYTPAMLREEVGKSVFGLVCTSHAIEGLDLPVPISATIMPEGQKVRASIQKTGRAARPGEQVSLVINIADVGISVLPRHARERAQAVQEEFDSPVYTVKNLEQLKALVERLDVKARAA